VQNCNGCQQSHVRGPALDLIVPILCSFNVDQKSNGSAVVVILFGQLELTSLRETPPRVREVKKQHLVRTMWDQPCQLEALGAIASTLFWIHMAARTTPH
jgi:hypothetical protein